MTEVQNRKEATGAPAAAEETVTMAPVVNAILATAVAAAAKRADGGDVAHGIIAGLRLLRSAVEAEAGYAMASAIDTAVRTRLLVENLSALRSTGRTPQAVALPPPGPGASVAAAIFVSAAESCLTVNAHAPDNAPLELAVFAFSTQLVQQLGGAPEWPALAGELHRPCVRRDAAQTAALPAGGGTVH